MSYEPLKGEVVIRINRREFDGDFVGWDGELSVNGEVVSEVTSPNFWGCLDVWDIFYEDHDYSPEMNFDMEYFRTDYNKRNWSE